MNHYKLFLERAAEQEELIVLREEPTLPPCKLLYDSQWAEDIREIYTELGGTRDYWPYDPPEFSLITEDFSVILDDEKHFNRYRRKTLLSDIYEDFNGIDQPKYLQICRQKEHDCLKSASHGPMWSNKEAESHFGGPEAPGDLGLNGSPAWKARAMADLQNDALLRIGKVNSVRISIHETIMVNKQLLTLKQLMQTSQPEPMKFVMSYIKRKAGLLK